MRHPVPLWFFPVLLACLGQGGLQLILPLGS